MHKTMPSHHQNNYSDCVEEKKQMLKEQNLVDKRCHNSNVTLTYIHTGETGSSACEMTVVFARHTRQEKAVRGKSMQFKP